MRARDTWSWSWSWSWSNDAARAPACALARSLRAARGALALWIALAAACTARPLEPLPQVPDQGGPRMAHPRLVTITYTVDPDRAQLEAYSQWIVGSQWLRAVGEEYGVGEGSVLGAVQLTAGAPERISGREIRDLLAQGLRDGTLPRPPDGDFANTLYVMHFPRGTTIVGDSPDDPSRSCVDFGAYHSTGRRDGGTFAYAAIAACPPPD